MKVDADSDKDSDFEVSDEELDDEVCLAVEQGFLVLSKASLQVTLSVGCARQLNNILLMFYVANAI